MTKRSGLPAPIASYLRTEPPESREKLLEIRAIALAEIGRFASCRGATQERIAWGMPTVSLFGASLLHYAGFKRHVSLFPGGSATRVWAPKLRAARLQFSRGTIQFQLEQPLPKALIRSVIAYCVRARIDAWENVSGPEGAKLGEPARRALLAHGVRKFVDLRRFSRQELLEWHGVGP